MKCLGRIFHALFEQRCLGHAERLIYDLFELRRDDSIVRRRRHRCQVELDSVRTGWTEDPSEVSCDPCVVKQVLNTRHCW